MRLSLSSRKSRELVLAAGPSSARNTVHGSGIANASEYSTSPRVDERVDQLVGELAHLVLELVDLARREQGVEQLAVLQVVGRVDLQRDERTVVAEMDRVHVGREDLGVAQREHHVLVAGDDHAHVRVHHRALVVEPVVDGLRACHDLGVEDRAELGDVAELGGGAAARRRGRPVAHRVIPLRRARAFDYESR